MADSRQDLDTEAAISDVANPGLTDEKLQTESSLSDSPPNAQISYGRKILLAGVLVATYFLSVSTTLIV